MDKKVKKTFQWIAGDKMLRNSGLVWENGTDFPMKANELTRLPVLHMCKA